MTDRKFKFSAALAAMLLLMSMFSFVIIARGNTDESYVIVVAPQEETEWESVIDRLLVYHTDAEVLTLPEDIQTVVMEAERQFRYLLMDGSLKSYLVYAYYAWGIRSIPVPWGYLRSGDILETNAIKYLDSKKAEIFSKFSNWFDKELGYQPHYVALVGDIKTRRSDWVSALGMTTWWDESLPYPADAWPTSINAGQVPVGYLPFIVDEVLAWYGYAVGRITGLTIEDAEDLVDRAGDYSTWASANEEKASKFVCSWTVGVKNYYDQVEPILTGAGFTTSWFDPEGPIPLFDDIKTALTEVGYWHLTCHGNFMTGMGGPGNGLITFPYSQSDYYSVMIGPGWSDIMWNWKNNDDLESKTTVSFFDSTFPWFDHTIVRITSCMTGSSEMPLQMVERGAAAVVMGIPSQEVCEGDANAAYFFNALTHTNPATGEQFTLGEAMAYANDNTHPLQYYYKAGGGMTYWNSMYLIGDPALTPYVPTVGEDPEPLDPQGNNPGSIRKLEDSDLIVPMAFEGPDGTIIIKNIAGTRSNSIDKSVNRRN